MRKVKIKIPAKINLTLDVLGTKNGYHEIESLVASVNIYDTITVKKRRENFVGISFKGEPINLPPMNSSAYYAAQEFKKEFSGGGAEIIVERSIPVAAGLGGSSADIAGVLVALKKFYQVSESAEHIANKLGSDVAYMMRGGFAVMKNRGEQVEFLEDVKFKLYVLILKGSKGVSTGECYKGFDELGVRYLKNTPIATRFLCDKDAKNLFGSLKNDLYESAKKILPEIEDNLNSLKKYGPAVMTGSGSATFAAFETKKERDAAYKELFPVYGDRLIKAETV